jgi:hypothetical protein
MAPGERCRNLRKRELSKRAEVRSLSGLANTGDPTKSKETKHGTLIPRFVDSLAD